MQEKGIVFTGITQATSDLDCKDGDLSISHNIINKDGAMRAIVVPDVAFYLNAGEQLLYIHKGDGYKNYFVIDAANLSYFTEANKKERHVIIQLSNRNINKIVSIGNSVAVLFKDGIEYLLYKDNAYKPLGNKPPELNISFGLVGTFGPTPLTLKVDCSKNQINPDSSMCEKLGVHAMLDNEGRTQATEQVLGEINTTLSNIKNNNEFSQPFFVCYAYKLLGQTDYMVSPPVLMNPVFYSRYPYGQVVKTDVRNMVLKGFELQLHVSCCALDYHIDEAKLAVLKEWGDVITSVDIYVSKEIPIYDQNGIVGDIINTASPIQSTNNIRCFPGVFARDKYNSEKEYDTIKPIYSKQGDLARWMLLDTPVRKHEDFEQDIKNTSTFYLYKSYKIENLKKHEIISTEQGVLNNLVTQPELNAIQDYNSHDILSASGAVVYNGRLSLTGVSKRFFGFSASALVQYNNGEKITKDAGTTDRSDYLEKTYGYKLTFLIKEDGKIVKATSEMSQLNAINDAIFYPNPNAFKVLIERTLSTGEKDYAEVGMKPHKFLNCAFTIDRIPPFKKTFDAAEYNVGTEAYDYNKVYTSDVGSIFNFPLSGRTTIGTGEVLGIGAISKALSPGQFGQFPLYSFSTEGVYAMEVNPNTGLFSSVHLISRDVCSNGDSITQIDGAVIFTSERGVMMVDGSEVRLISAEMDGPNFNIATVSQLDAVLTKEGVHGEIGGMVRFGSYIKDCRIAYDYPNNRLIIFNHNHRYGYIYSIDSRSWATLTANFKHVVTDYPNVYIQRVDNMVLDLFEKVNYDSGKTARTVIVSRPLKFGDAEYKSINAVIKRGILNNTGGIILFGSSDGNIYVPIGSAVGNRLSRLQGSPYRYFRLALVGEMEINEALSMASIFVTSKWNNKPR